MAKRIVILISAGAIVACLVGIVTAIVGAYLPTEWTYPVTWGLIVVFAIVAAILLNRR